MKIGETIEDLFVSPFFIKVEENFSIIFLPSFGGCFYVIFGVIFGKMFLDYYCFFLLGCYHC